MQEQIRGGGVFTVQCHDKDGNLKWEIAHPNLVVNQGLAYMNDTFFSGSGYTKSWYLGLIQGPAGDVTISAGDTLASHGATGAGGWTEIPVTSGYSGNRKSLTFGSASSANPSVIANGTAAQFAMLGTYVVSGAFLCTVATGTSGVLFSASQFEAPGDRSVVAGDTLNVTYTFELAAT
jgi:hypothetical protein